MAAEPTALAFPWARTYDADQVDAFIEDLWGAASGNADLATLDAIEKVIAEHRPAPVPCPLTEREIEILTEIASGETCESAAGNLALTVDSVRSRCSDIYTRLGARCAAQATAIAAHHGWLPDLRTPPLIARVPKLTPYAWKAIYRERAAEMRKKPGEVVEIGPYGSRDGARRGALRISQGLLDVFRPAGFFKAEAIPIDHARWIVRARYLGALVDTARKEAS